MSELDLLLGNEEPKLPGSQIMGGLDFQYSNASLPFKPLIEAAEEKYGLLRGLLPRMIHQESTFVPTKVSPKGALGIAQIMPQYHPGVNPWNPSEAIDYAGNLLKKHYDYFGDWEKAAASYNAGAKRVESGNLPAETVDYITKVFGKAPSITRQPTELSELELLTGPTPPPAPPKEQPVIQAPNPPGGWNEAGQPLNSSKIPYPFMFKPGKGVSNVAMISPLAGITSASALPKQVAEKNVGSNLFKGAVSLPMTAINTIAGFISWPVPLVAGLGTYLSYLTDGYDHDVAKQIADKTVAEISRYMPRLPNTETGRMQEEAISSFLGWPKAASQWIADVTGLKSIMPKIPGQAGEIVDHLTDVAGDFLSAGMALQMVGGAPKIVSKGAELLQHKTIARDLNTRGAEVKAVKESGGLSPEEVAKAAEAQKNIAETQAKLDAEALAKKEAIEAKKVAKKEQTELELLESQPMEQPLEQLVEPSPAVEPTVEPAPVEIPAKPMTGAERARAKKAAPLEPTIEEAPIELPAVDQATLTEMELLTKQTGLDLFGLGKKEPITDLDLQTGTPLPEALSTDKNPFRETDPEVTTKKNELYSGLKSVATKFDDLFNNPTKPYRSPETTTSKLINDVNRWLDGDDSVDIAKTRDRLSEMAARADELKPEFSMDLDHKNWANTTSEAAVWAREADRAKIERTPGTTRLNIAIPLDEIPKAVKDLISKVKVTFGDLYRNKEIYDKTGFWFGRDGMWRYELKDPKIRIEIPLNARVGDVIPLRDVVKGLDEAFEAIPDLQTVGVKYSPGLSTDGDYNSASRLIQIRDLRNKDTMIHEVQHAINDLVGSEFRGSNYDKADLILNLKTVADRLDMMKSLAKTESGKQITSDLAKQLRIEAEKPNPYPGVLNSFYRIAEDLGKLEGEGFERTLRTPLDVGRLSSETHTQYLKDPGEMQSRLEEIRDKMTPAQRKAEPPWETLDKMLRSESWGFDEEGNIYERVHDHNYEKAGTKLYSGIPVDQIKKMMKLWHGAKRGIQFLQPLETAPFRTGEGGMARGAGLYVSEEQNVGVNYAKMGEEPTIKFKGESLRFPGGKNLFHSIHMADIDGWLRSWSRGELSFDKLKDKFNKDADYNIEEATRRINQLEKDLVEEQKKPYNSEIIAETTADLKGERGLLKDASDDKKLISSMKESDFTKEGGSRYLHEIEVPVDAKWLDWDKPIKDTLSEEDISKIQKGIDKIHIPDMEDSLGKVDRIMSTSSIGHTLLYDGKVYLSNALRELVRNPTRFNDIIQNKVSELSQMRDSKTGPIHASDIESLIDFLVKLHRSDLSKTKTIADGFIRANTNKLSDTARESAARLFTQFDSILNLSEETIKNRIKSYIDNYNANPEIKAMTEAERVEVRRLVDKVRPEDLFHGIYVSPEMTGGEIYRTLDRAMQYKFDTAAGDIEASKFLRDLGFAGNKFAGVSGNAPYSNYVLFAPEKYAKITSMKLFSGTPDFKDMADALIKAGRAFSRYSEVARGMKDVNVKETAKKVKRELVRLFLEKSGNVRQDLIKELKDKGYEVQTAMYLQAGGHPKAVNMLTQMRKEVYDGLPKGFNKIIDDLTSAERMIDIGKYKSPSQYSFPEGRTPADSAVYKELFMHKNINGVKDLTPAEVADITKRVQAYFDWMKKPVEDAFQEGLITEKERDALISHNYRRTRLVEDVFDAQTVMTIGGKKMTVNDSGIEHIQKGKKTDIYEPSSEIMALETFNRLYGRIYRNKAGKEILDLARTDPNNPFARVKLSKDDKIPSDFRVNSVKVYENGKPIRVYLSPEMAKEWVTSNAETTYRYAQFIRYVSGAPIVRTFATGINWAFALRNLPRDIMQIWFTARTYKNGKYESVYSPTSPIAAFQMTADLAGTFRDALLRKGKLNDYIDDGGGMDILTTQGRMFRKGKHLESKIDKFYDFAGYAGTTSELMTRLAVRDRVIKNRASELGISYEEAAKDPKIRREATFAARDYMDFHQGGTITKAIDNGFPYLDARVVATRGFLRALAKDQPVVTMYKLAQFAALTTGLYIGNQAIHPETMSALENDQRTDGNLVFPIGDNFSLIDSRGQKRYPFFVIPIDQGMMPFKAMFEVGTDLWLGNPTGPGKILRSIQALSPVDIGTLPPTISAVFGYKFNKDFWQGKDIRQEGQLFKYQLPEWFTGQELGGSQREYNAKTPQALIDMGRLTGLSPERLKYMAGQLVTNDNMFAQLLGIPYQKAFGQLPPTERAASWTETLANVPILRTFFKLTNPYAKQSVIIDSAREQGEVRIYTQNVGLDTRVNGYLYDGNYSRHDVERYIRSFKDEDTQDRLQSRFDFAVAARDLPNKAFWLQLKGIADTEARARAYVEAMNQAKPEEYAQLKHEQRKVEDIGGVLTEGFWDHVSQIRRGR